MQWATKFLGICVYMCGMIPEKPEGWGMTEQRRKESRHGGPRLARKAGRLFGPLPCLRGGSVDVLLLRILLQEGGGKNPSFLSVSRYQSFLHSDQTPHFWVLPPAPEAKGVGTSPGLLLSATPSLGSLISLREPVFFFFLTKRFVLQWSFQLTNSVVIVSSEQQRDLRESIPAAAVAAKSLHSCPTLWDPKDGSPPGSSIPGILQARKLEWVAISFSSACSLQSCPTLCDPMDSNPPGFSVHRIL